MAKPLKPLKITCTSTDCGSNLHCFLSTKKAALAGEGGRCRSCGVALVDWERVHRKDARDASYFLKALQFEYFRHYFWHLPLLQRAANHALRKGRILLRQFARGQLEKLVGSGQHPREGYQTPRETSPGANSVHFAQHAVAACCRKCMAVWHGIPEGTDLTESELAYLVDLVMLYIEDRLPALQDAGMFVPKIRRHSTNEQESSHASI
jgi:hypothetical protein